MLIVFFLIVPNSFQQVYFKNEGTQNVPVQVESSVVQVYQETQNATFVYRPTAQEYSRYLVLKVEIQDTGQDTDIGQVLFNCSAYQQSPSIFRADMNGYFLRRYNHMVQFSPGTIQENSELQCQITKYNPRAILKYFLRISSFKHEQCQNYCNQNKTGLCVQNEPPVCVCKEEFIGLDCSLPAIRLREIEQQLHLSKAVKYYYFEPKEVYPQIQIIFKQPQSGLTAYVLKENSYDGAPSEWRNDGTHSINDTNTMVSVDSSELNYDSTYQRQKRLLIAMTSPTNQSVFVIVKGVKSEQGTDGRIMLYIVLSVSAFMVVGLAVYAVYRITSQRRLVRQQQLQAIRNNQDESRMHSVSHSAELTRINNPSGLSLVLEAVMPELAFQDCIRKKSASLQSLFRIQKDSCSVCLIEFQAESVCRQPPCGHIFHSPCLLRWMRKNDTCPICRYSFNQNGMQQMLAEEVSNPITFGPNH